MAARKASRSKQTGEKTKKSSSKKGRVAAKHESSSTDAKREKASAAAKREMASGSIDQNIVKALAHPLRVRILTILNDRVASPNELHKELEEGLSQISYHVKVLKDFELIEQVKTEPRRGAVEHYYRATNKVYVPGWLAKAWPKSARRGVANTLLEEVETDVAESLTAGVFDDRPDCVVARDPRVLDGQGRTEAEEAAAEFFVRFQQISAESDERLKKGEGDGEKIQTSAVVLVFTSLSGKKLKLKRKKS